MIEGDVLYLLLEGIVKGGAGPMSQWVCERWPWFQLQTRKVKFVVALSVSSVIGAAAYGLAVVMLYQPTPADWREWVVALVTAAAVSSGFSQIIHRLGKKR